MSHSYFACYEHIVFSTQGRKPWFKDPLVAERLFKYLNAAVRNQGCQCQRLGGHENHVHILLRMRKGLLTEDLVREIKKSSSTWFSDTFPENLNRRESFHWQGGYGAFSVSYWDLEKIGQ